jgi:hypothetical protein
MEAPSSRSFHLKPPARKGEWMHEHPEPIQSMDEYRKQVKKTLVEGRETLYVQPLQLGEQVVSVATLEEYLSVFFLGIQTKVAFFRFRVFC